MESTPQSLERYADLLSGDRLIYTNHMLRHPIFGSGVPDVRFLNGYDAGIFRTNTIETVTKTVLQSGPKGLSDEPILVKQTETVAPLVVPERFQDARSAAIGDVVLFQDATQLTKYRIVGSYHSATQINYLFCPLVYELSPDLLFSEDADVSETLAPYTFENAQFTLKHSGDLPALKAFLLSSGYSEVRQIHQQRTFVVLYDSSFLYTTLQLEQRIAALPSFVPLIIGVGMAVAVLLVFLRRREAALMKLLGTGRFRIFLCLWLEQLILCAAGAGLAFCGFFCRNVLTREGIRWALLLAIGTLLCAALSAAMLCITKRRF